MTKQNNYAPDANHDKGLAKTAEKCFKKRYEINIFFVRDQNMTKKTPMRQMLITMKDLQKHVKT